MADPTGALDHDRIPPGAAAFAADRVMVAEAIQLKEKPYPELLVLKPIGDSRF